MRRWARYRSAPGADITLFQASPPDVRLDAEPALERANLVKRLVEDRQADDRVDDEAVDPSPTDACGLKLRRCPNTPARRVPRSIDEGARDLARDIAKTDACATSRRAWKKAEMLFAHLKRIQRLDRLRLRRPTPCRHPC